MVYPHSYRTEHSETRTTNAAYGEYYADLQSKKIAIQPKLLKIINWIDSHRDFYVENLERAVEIKSISGDLKYKNNVIEMVKFTEGWLFKLGIKYECINIGFHEIDGRRVRLPPIILASLGSDSKKKTLCIYVNLDIPKPNKSQWSYDPWKVTKNELLYFGCGVASGKGTLISWFHVIEAFQGAHVEFPVNIKFVIESMYHHGSRGLSDFLPLHKNGFFANLDSIIVCDSQWIGEKHPCLVYGTVGILHFEIFIEKTPDSKTDPRDDMVEIFKSIVDDEEHILIPHFSDIVTQITPAEEKKYSAITDFNIEEVRKSLPAYKQKWDKVKLLMSYWRLPSIWVGDTEECTCDPKDANVVKRHFIIKLVPRQIIARCTGLITGHIENVAKKDKIENKVECNLIKSTRYWHENGAAPHYEAARRATIQIYKEDPNMIREDRERSVLTILDEVLENPILLLPLVPKSSNMNGDNENISTRNLFESKKLLAAYLFQMAIVK